MMWWCIGVGMIMWMRCGDDVVVYRGRDDNVVG